ncbi:hypothetical protein Y032_0203g1828 [Ancylostoma ceylanicum]|uniref:Uncharacterized protein n=1 Tax=Ancylostoma ceylanicum TaxID=53326 RepID=A0A016SMU9_9BILA|nr:hypothetical protein Y032_0203g1828 [Ancylostoma ceylanicum]
MSSGPFVDRAEAEAKTKELERYLFEDGLAGALLEFLRTLNSMPADKRPSDPMESLLKAHTATLPLLHELALVMRDDISDMAAKEQH